MPLDHYALPLDRYAGPPKPSPEYTVRDQEGMRLAQNYFEWQARLAEPHLGRRVLEIGCGLGNFTRHLLDRELVIGIDVEPACVEAWRSAFPESANLMGFAMDVLDSAFLDLKRHQPDTIVCLNVLEHIEEDKRALEQMHAVLPPGGRALLIVPAFESLYGPIDRNLGHFRRYSKENLRRLSESVGFRTMARFFNAAGLVGWWVNAKILKRTEQSQSQIRWFDRMIVPALSRVEAVAAPPFGQSIFAVLEKPAAGNGVRRP
jgi:SAM-dependent methyltransferase